MEAVRRCLRACRPIFKKVILLARSASQIRELDSISARGPTFHIEFNLSDLRVQLVIFVANETSRDSEAILWPKAEIFVREGVFITLLEIGVL